MTNTIKEGKQIASRVRDVSKTRGYINISIDVLNCLSSFDCISRQIWITLYQAGYFSEGVTTITLQNLAESLKISRSCLENKLKELIEAGYLVKQQNFDHKNHHYLPSTFCAILPESELDRISLMPTRRECFELAGRFVTKDHQNDEIKNTINHSQAPVNSEPKHDLQTKIHALERVPSTNLAAKVECMVLRAKLKSINDGVEKNLLQKISTIVPFENEGSPTKKAIKNNILKIDITKNKGDISLKMEPDCSFASQATSKKVPNHGYRNEPMKLSLRIKEKISNAVRESRLIAQPEVVIAEAEFAVARCFMGDNQDHAANIFCKLLRTGRWTTPVPMRMAQDRRI